MIDILNQNIGSVAQTYWMWTFKFNWNINFKEYSIIQKLPRHDNYHNVIIVIV